MRALALIGAIVAFLVSPALADIKVRVYTASGTAIPTLSQDNIVSGTPISIALISTAAQVFIFDGNSIVPNESIGAVTISGSTSASALFVVVGNPLIASVTIPDRPDAVIDPLSPNATYAVDFAGLTVSTTSERAMTVFCAQISGNVTGGVTVGKIRRLVAGGSVSALLWGRNDQAGGSPGSTDDYAVGRVQAQSITSAGEVRSSLLSGFSTAAAIYRVQVNSLLGPVHAFDGRIRFIDVAQDIAINASGISAIDRIDSVEANSISLTSVLVNGNGPGLGRVRTRTGDFTGGIIAPALRSDVVDPGIQITGTLSDNVSIGLLGGSGNALSPITVGNMAVTTTLSVSGNVQANITATGASGTLGRILVMGQLGTTSFPVTVNAPGGIGEISALSVNASVTSTSGSVGPVTAPAGWTGSLNVASVGTFSVGGWSGGTATIRNVVPAVQTLNFGSVSSSGALSLSGGLDGRVVIAGPLTGSMSLPASGLDGQVIVNAANGGSGWTGSVTVGGTPLAPAPYYSNPSSASVPSSTVGNGAVGRAPYHLYRTDCLPEHNGYRWTEEFSSGNPIYVAYYGPIARRAGSGDAPLVTIELHRAYSGFNEDDQRVGEWKIANPCFIVTVDTVNPRRLKLVPDTAMPMAPPPGLYRVRATADLVCAGVTTGSPAVHGPVEEQQNPDTAIAGWSYLSGLPSIATGTRMATRETSFPTIQTQSRPGIAIGTESSIAATSWKASAQGTATIPTFVLPASWRLTCAIPKVVLVIGTARERSTARTSSIFS